MGEWEGEWMSRRVWCDMGFSLATYLHSMSTGLSVTCVCEFCLKRDKSCTTFVIVENKKATHLCTELHCNVGLPLCWKALRSHRGTQGSGTDQDVYFVQRTAEEV